MATKKKNELTYMQLPLPQGRRGYTMTKRSWSGLNKRQTIDTGNLSMESNISTAEAPYLTPSQEHISVSSRYTNPISLFGFDDFLIVIYRESTALYVDYLTFDEDGDLDSTYTGVLQSSGATSKDEYPRSVVQFNVYDTPTDPVTGKFIKKLLIFPDKKSMFFHTDDLLNDENNDTGNDFKIYDMDVLVKTYKNDTAPYLPPETASHNYYYKNTSTEAIEADTEYGAAVYRWVDDESDSDNSGWKISIPPSMPGIKYAAVHLSRLFGVDDDRVYASGYNDYTNWNLDTVDEYNESNAWCSPAQSNTKAGGVFTGITTYQNYVICFKKDFMHELYNTKNPFRIQDVFAEGAIDNRTIQDVDGKLIFVSEDDVKIFTGSNPRIIGYNLNIAKFEHAVSGTDNRNYYLYCEDEHGTQRLFVYDTYFEEWSEQDIYSAVLNFAHNKHGMYMLCENGYVYQLDSKSYDHSWSFETDLITNETVNIKHIKKIQLFADVAPDADVKVYFLYDDETFDADTSQLAYSSTGYGRKAIRVKPRLTAHYGVKLHIEGNGYVRLYELELGMETGGDLYVEN